MIRVYFFLAKYFSKMCCNERKGIGNTHEVYFLLLSPDNPKWLLLKEVKVAKVEHSSSTRSCSFLLYFDKSCHKEIHGKGVCVYEGENWCVVCTHAATFLQQKVWFRGFMYSFTVCFCILPTL